MPDYTNIINTLNKKILVKLNKVKFVPDEGGEEVSVQEYTGGMGFSQHYSMGHYGGNSHSRGYDPRDAASQDKNYETHRPHQIVPDHMRPGDKRKKKDDEEEKHFVDLDPEENPEEMTEQEGGDLAPDPGAEAMPKEEPAEPEMPENLDAGGDLGDPGMGTPGSDITDPGMGDPNAVMPGEEPPKDPNELGRTYEMKKIYARLVSMNQYLADEQDQRIMKTKQSIAKAIDLFAVIGANPDSYKEKIDEIIVGYYKFLEAAYKRVRSFYKTESQKAGGAMPLDKKEEQTTETDTEVKI